MTQVITHVVGFVIPDESMRIIIPVIIFLSALAVGFFGFTNKTQTPLELKQQRIEIQAPSESEGQVSFSPKEPKQTEPYSLPDVLTDEQMHNLEMSGGVRTSMPQGNSLPKINTEPIQPSYSAPKEKGAIQATQQECSTKGISMVNQSFANLPTSSTLVNQRNAFVKALYGNKQGITSEEWASLNSKQQLAINGSDRNEIEKGIDEISVQQKVLDKKMEQLPEMLYMVRVICGTVTTQEQILYELEKIQSSLQKIIN